MGKPITLTDIIETPTSIPVSDDPEFPYPGGGIMSATIGLPTTTGGTTGGTITFARPPKSPLEIAFERQEETNRAILEAINRLNLAVERLNKVLGV